MIEQKGACMGMSYQALYRVWRPQSFKDVVGQNHITKTLQNAMLQEKFSHAYLFSGPRGTGKTSAAKIVAKAINCEHAPIAEPCNNCHACLGITNGSISDVIEIDAASNNGVAEIRYIRDNVKLAPGDVKYKVYIIDEVHMLSEGAFNALLKTLEEPPKHVIFILATTEPHKIPLTIISRCQRFDFRRIPPQAMVDRMQEIIRAQQHVDVQEEALHIVAQVAEGGMRDALSLLDQILSYSDDKVTVEDALSVTGSVSQTLLQETAHALLIKDTGKALHTVDELIRNGKEPKRFLEDLIFYFRDMLLYQSAPELEKVFERVTVNNGFKELAEKTATTWIYKVIEMLNQSQQEMKFTNHPKVFLEIALVKICDQKNKEEPEADPQALQDMQKKIRMLETELKTIKESGIQQISKKETPPEKRPQRSASKTMQVPMGKINGMLKKATKQDLHELKGKWAAVMDHLKKEKISAHATLIDSEPVAASEDSFILSFKYEIHCKMAGDNRDIIERIVEQQMGRPYTLIEIPEQEWAKIKEEYIRTQKNNDENERTEAEEDPLIAEAKKMFGEELIEIKD
jgi:DNA polymerase-3 subunit gamma/tau